MEITTLFIIIAALLIIVMFWPDIFPYCSSCKKVKPRFRFKIHKSVNLRLGYSANRSVCKKCCGKYGIDSLREYERIEQIRKRLQYRLQNKL